jgi:Mlc titration factor MtfA (ptsG expression regulator)
MRVTIAGLAGVLLLGIEHDYYSHVLSILVYPDAYAVPAPVSPHTWLVDEEQERLGEAWYRGPVVLSWDDVLWDAQHPGEGQNLVWHEFAHQLDMLDREINGTPPLGTREAARRWHEVMTAEFERLGDDADAGRESLLDPYGASDEAEFFSVATESFFDQPHALRAEHPGLYDLLRTYYRQDPAERMPAPVLHAEPARRRRRKKRT